MNRSTPASIALTLLMMLNPAYADTRWQLITGSHLSFDVQNFNIQPTQIPTVDASGNTPYLDSTPSPVTPLLLIDDSTYADRKNYSSWAAPTPFLGLQAPISEQWFFRIKGTYLSRSYRLLDMRTMIYTPQSLPSIPEASATCGENACTQPSLLPNSTETLTLSANGHPEVTLSFLYRYSDYFQAGVLLSQVPHNYSLTLNESTPTTFKPLSTEWGIESLFRLSEHTQLSTSLVVAQSNDYVQRLLNFQVTASSSDPTSYALSYIPVEGETPWQACTGYLVDGSTCDTSSTAASTTLNNYYYNDQTPANYGTTVSANNLQSSLGPQVWWARYHLRASLAIEWFHDLDRLLPKRVR